MPLVKRFLLATVLWAAGIMLLIVPISLMTVDDLTYVHQLRWLAHSVAIATLPAGLTVGADVFRRGRVRDNLIVLTIAELVVMGAVLGLLIFAAKLDDMNLIALLTKDSEVENIGGWRVWNQLVFPIYMTAAEAISVPIYSGLGIMVGAWAEQVLSPRRRRLVYWGLSLTMIALTYLITDHSYEMLVIKTDGPAAFSAFFMLLVPFGMYVGLLLPSISLARRVQTQ
jgi:hypothetical protein